VSGANAARLIPRYIVQFAWCANVNPRSKSAPVKSESSPAGGFGDHELMSTELPPKRTMPGPSRAAAVAYSGFVSWVSRSTSISKLNPRKSAGISWPGEPVATVTFAVSAGAGPVGKGRVPTTALLPPPQAIAMKMIPKAGRRGRTSDQHSRPVPVDPFRRFGRGNHGMHLELDQVAPVRDPLVEQRAVVRLHHLIAATQVVVDPARDVGETLRGQASLGSEAAIHRRGVTVPEVLDDHVDTFHDGNLSCGCKRALSAMRPQIVRPCALTHAIAANGGRPKSVTSAAAITMTAGVETISDTLARIKTPTINSADAI